jgi:erythromycin esterase-like protein
VTVAEAIRPLAGEASDYDLVVERAAGARFALLGEASHGTHEFYKERAEITRRLITEQGFGFVAVEGDWPDAYRVNRYVRGESDDGGPEEALGDFRRFPSWMWRNTDVVDFVAWLREWNDALPLGEPRVGFYGLDLYSLYTSMEEVIRYLDEIDPEAAQRARERYSCFDHFGRDPQTYAYQAVTGGTEPCEPQVVRQLVELLSRRLEISENETILDGDRQFYAEQNARLVVNAERYYRAAFWGGPESWNLRDRHMVETLEALVEHLEQTRRTVKGAVWAHNSHVGDARATEMGRRGELNVGQLVRGRYGDEALIGGFTTFAGTVTAASDWGAVAERKNARPARSDSWEWLFHDTRVPRFLIETCALEGQRL